MIELLEFSRSRYDDVRYWRFRKGELSRAYSEKEYSTYSEALAAFERDVAGFEAAPVWRRGIMHGDTIYLYRDGVTDEKARMVRFAVAGFNDDAETVTLVRAPVASS